MCAFYRTGTCQHLGNDLANREVRERNIFFLLWGVNLRKIASGSAGAGKQPWGPRLKEDVSEM